MSVERALRIVSELWTTELDSGLSLLRQIPSGAMACFVDGFAHQSHDDSRALASIFAKRGACILARSPFSALPLTSLEESVEAPFREAVEERRWNDWRFLSLRMTKTIVTSQERWGGDLEVTREAALLAEVPSAKAAQLKKLLREAFSPAGYRLVTTSPGSWCLSLEPRELAGHWLCFDFRGMDSQLRYEVGQPLLVGRPRTQPGLTYELAMGLVGYVPAQGGWNRITAEGAPDAVALVHRLVGYLVPLQAELQQR